MDPCATSGLMHCSKQHIVAFKAHGRFPLLAVGQRSPCPRTLALLLMRGAEVGKLLENVGVRFQTAGRAFALGQEREAVIDHVVSEDTPVGIFRRFRRVETQHVGQCALLVDLRNRFFA